MSPRFSFSQVATVMSESITHHRCRQILIDSHSIDSDHISAIRIQWMRQGRRPQKSTAIVYRQNSLSRVEWNRNNMATGFLVISRLSRSHASDGLYVRVPPVPWYLPLHHTSFHSLDPLSFHPLPVVCPSSLSGERTVVRGRRARPFHRFDP